VDMLDTESRNQFWQLGVGAEVATRYVELRGNYYIPTTDRKLAERRVTTEQRSSSRTRESIQNDLGNPYDNGTGLLLQDSTTSVVSTTTTTTETFRHIFERYEKSLEGWDIELAVLVPYIDQWTDVKLIGGYMNLRNSPFGPQTGGTGAIKGWKAGVEIRPVPAIALTGMWYEDKKFLGADWVVGARMEIPFELGEIGDGKTFWSRIGDAFHPRRRHLAERMAEPVHRQNAAIKTGNSQKETTQTVSTQTTSHVQVLSQTKNQIILGVAPSGTNFQYTQGGTFNVAGAGFGATTQTGAGAGGATQNIQGSLYVNGAGQSILVPDGGGSALLINHSSAITFFSPSNTTPPVTQTVLVPDNSVGLIIQATRGASTNTSPNSNTTTVGLNSLTLSGTQTSATAFLPIPVFLTSSGTLTLTGNLSSGGLMKSGGVTINGGSLSTGTGSSFGSAISLGGVYTGSATTTITGAYTGTPNTVLNSAAGNVVVGNVSQSGPLTINSGSLNFSSSTTLSSLSRYTAINVTGIAGVTINGQNVPFGNYPITNGTITVGGNVISLIPTTSN
jgi:Inverse autotransporter, beta-domain